MSKNGLGFLANFKKNISKLSTVNIGISSPKKWYSTGNYALNKILSGSYFKGIPESRITAFVGPSGSGKSFLSSNFLKSAQDDGAHLVVLDTENAIDVEFLQKLGVDVSEDKLTYIQVGMIEDVNSICSDFFSNYEKEHGRYNYDAPRIVFVLDSLAMLSTSTEVDNYDGKGEIKGDQGQRAKRMKAMLRMIISRIAKLPITFVITDHVYPQDVMLGDGPWAITNSTKFFPSIIGLVTRLKLKEDTEIVGVRMRIETYKSRFAKLGSKIELEVPYATGMSPISGLLDMLEGQGIVSKAGAWYTAEINGETLKFQRKTATLELIKKLFQHPTIIAEEALFETAVKDEAEMLNEMIEAEMFDEIDSESNLNSFN